MKQKNLWQNSANENISFKPLKALLVSDLIIIGGGYTGCSAALFAAKKGLSVALIDQKIGYGGSGRNVGLVNAGLWLHPKKVEKILGAEAGVKLNNALASAHDLVFSLINENEINCSANRSGTLHCAHSQKGLADIELRFKQLSERGAELELLDRNETQQRTGSSSFFGSLLNKKAGTINPLDYCQGLARAAHSQGASIYESTLATKIQSSNNHWMVETSQGSIKAKMLLIATNAYQQPITGIKSSEYTSVQYFQVATDPLPEKISKMILPNGEGCWDTASVMSSFRLDESNRFIIGGVGNLDHIASKIHTKWAKRKMESLFPMLKNIPIKYSWHGRIAMTNSHIPKIVKLGNNAYSIYGYSGRGIGPGTYFGKAVAECLLNNNEDYLPVSPVNDNQELFRSIKSKAFELGATARHLL
tara:strand:+ start:26 stop:1279 length:1254 start_codon:yes stop_codon:yes gene_type:complete